MVLKSKKCTDQQKLLLELLLPSRRGAFCSRLKFKTFAEFDLPQGRFFKGKNMSSETEKNPLLEADHRVRARRMTIVYCGIQRMMTREERVIYDVPDTLDPHAVQSTLVNCYLGTSPLNPDMHSATLQAFTGIRRFISDILPINQEVK